MSIIIRDSETFRYYETLYYLPAVESRYCFVIAKIQEMMSMQKLRLDMDIGQNIQAMRRRAGLTQDMVVAQMGVMGIEISKSTYAKLETNRMNIKISELVALKRIFNCTFEEFFVGLDDDSTQCTS